MFWVRDAVAIISKYNKKERWMGIGLFILILAMVAATLVEIGWLNIVKAYGLVYDKGTPIQMRILLQIPQHILVGASKSLPS